jgi:outer membrane protein TolC
VREALEKNPEYARARAELAAERERIPQAGALGDPTLTLGIQNDGFQRIEIGNMETSFWQVMVTQPIPWRQAGLREEVARSTASGRGALRGSAHHHGGGSGRTSTSRSYAVSWSPGDLDVL